MLRAPKYICSLLWMIYNCLTECLIGISNLNEQCFFTSRYTFSSLWHHLSLVSQAKTLQPLFSLILHLQSICKSYCSVSTPTSAILGKTTISCLVYCNSFLDLSPCSHSCLYIASNTFKKKYVRSCHSSSKSNSGFS